MPAGRRSERVAVLVQQELSTLLMREVKDPLLRQLTLTGVKMTPDLRMARVYYVPLVEGADSKTIEAGLERAKGFLRRQLGQRLKLRHVPSLHFHYDESLNRGRRMNQLLAELDEERDPAGEASENQGSGEE